MAAHYMLGFDRGSTMEKVAFARLPTDDSGISADDIDFVIERGEPFWPSAFAFKAGTLYYGHEAVDAVKDGTIDESDLLLDLKFGLEEPHPTHTKAVRLYQAVTDKCAAWGTTPWQVLLCCLRKSLEKAKTYIESFSEGHEHSGSRYHAILCVPELWKHTTRRKYADVALEAGLGCVATVPESACAAVFHLQHSNKWGIGTEVRLFGAGGMTADTNCVVIRGVADNVPQLDWSQAQCLYHGMRSVEMRIGSRIAIDELGIDPEDFTARHDQANKIMRVLRGTLEQFKELPRRRFTPYQVKNSRNDEVHVKVIWGMVHRMLKEMATTYATMVSSESERQDPGQRARRRPDQSQKYVVLTGGTTLNPLIKRTIEETLLLPVIQGDKDQTFLAPAAGAIIGAGWGAFSNFTWRARVVWPGVDEFSEEIEGPANLRVVRRDSDGDVKME